MVIGAEMWVNNPCIGHAPGGGFQHRVAQQITGRQTRQLLERMWDYPLMETLVHEAGFK